MEEKNESKEKAKKEKPIVSKTKEENNKTIILQVHSCSVGNTEELEEKYSEKFGCKVVVLESNLKLVDIIDG